MKCKEILPEEQQKSSRPCRPTYCNCQSRSKEEHVELLEATASGIHVYSLEERIARARSHYKVIAVRKLRGFNNTDKSQARLESLISKVRGRGYQFMNKRVFMMGYVVCSRTKEIKRFHHLTLFENAGTTAEFRTKRRLPELLL